MTPGIVYATLAYMAWGLFPLYFRQVAHVPALEVVVHRTVWSLVFVLAVLAVDLPRPRNRVALAEDPRYVHCRKAVIDFLYTRQAHVEKAA